MEMYFKCHLLHKAFSAVSSSFLQLIENILEKQMSTWFNDFTNKKLLLLRVARNVIFYYRKR